MPSQTTPCTGLSQKHLARITDELELYDSLEPQMRALASKYGLKNVLENARQFYGRWAEAENYLEAQRQALQLKRLENM